MEGRFSNTPEINLLNRYSRKTSSMQEKYQLNKKNLCQEKKSKIKYRTAKLQ